MSIMDGEKIDITSLNLFMYGELDPEFPHLTKKQRDRAKSYYASLRENLPKTGHIFIASTVEDMNGSNDEFIKLWNE